MSAEEMIHGVEAIENRAEKLLEEARSQANEILRRANEEAAKIQAAKLSLDDVKAEGEKMVNKAKEAAEGVVAAAKKEAAQVKESAAKGVEKISRRLVDIVAGAKTE